MFRKMKMTHRKIDSAFYLSLVPFVTTSRRNVSIPESCVYFFFPGDGTNPNAHQISPVTTTTTTDHESSEKL